MCPQRAVGRRRWRTEIWPLIELEFGQGSGLGSLGRNLMRVKLDRDGVKDFTQKKSGHLGFVLYSLFRAVRAFRVVLPCLFRLKSLASNNPCVHARHVSGQIAQRAHTTPPPRNLGKRQSLKIHSHDANQAAVINVRSCRYNVVKFMCVLTSLIRMRNIATFAL